MSTTDRARGWILTLPAEHYSQEYVEEKLRNYTHAGQLEKGKQGGDAGYEHWQIYIENANQIAFKTLQNKFPKGHFEVRKGSKQQAYDYVVKSETALGVRIGNGEIDLTEPEQGARNDLKAYADQILLLGKSIDEVLLTDPRAARYIRELERLVQARENIAFGSKEIERSATYIWGKTGLGKTSSALRWFGAEATQNPDYRNIYRVSDYAHPFDGYEGERTIILDEFMGQLPFESLLNIADRYPVKLSARYRDKLGTHTRLVVVSNVPLSSQYRRVQFDNPARWNALMRRFETGGSLRLEQHAGETFVIPEELPVLADGLGVDLSDHLQK